MDGPGGKRNKARNSFCRFWRHYYLARANLSLSN